MFVAKNHIKATGQNSILLLNLSDTLMEVIDDTTPPFDEYSFLTGFMVARLFSLVMMMMMVILTRNDSLVATLVVVVVVVVIIHTRNDGLVASNGSFVMVVVVVVSFITNKCSLVRGSESESSRNAGKNKSGDDFQLHIVCFVRLNEH